MDGVDDMELAIQDYILQNRDLFEGVQNSKSSSVSASPRNGPGKHYVLNYLKILDEMIKYLKGYHDYKKAGDKKYISKILQSTYSFYDKMFKDPKYRKEITLSEFPQINYKFIEKSKELNSLIRGMKKSIDNEVLNLAKVTENQYKKLAKVNRDDMKIYLWLTTNSQISGELRAFYGDFSTPVMHKVRR